MTWKQKLSLAKTSFTICTNALYLLQPDRSIGWSNSVKWAISVLLWQLKLCISVGLRGPIPEGEIDPGNACESDEKTYVREKNACLNLMRMIPRWVN